jgi:hypothetical protein
MLPLSVNVSLLQLLHPDRIQRNTRAGVAQRAQQVNHRLRIVETAAFRHLQHQGARGDTGCASCNI